MKEHAIDRTGWAPGLVSVEDMPRRIRQLHRDKRGYPVPWFVPWIDGKPEFRAMAQEKLDQAMQARLCWICGKPRGAEAWFVIGPMCAINRTSAEPPSHRDCAVYSATHCPFLTTPRMHRVEQTLPEGSIEGAGIMLKRNPGVALVWHSARFEVFHPPGGGVLFDIGEPVETLWYAEGRTATRDEVTASIESGLPLLRAECDKQPGGYREQKAAHAALDRQCQLLDPILPEQPVPAG